MVLVLNIHKGCCAIKQRDQTMPNIENDFHDKKYSAYTSVWLGFFVYQLSRVI